MKQFQQAKRMLCDSTTSTCRRILGIDPGYGRCGWTILEDNNKQIKLIACDCIETSAKNKLPNRLMEITDGLEYIIKKYKPTEMAIESLFWFKNKKTAMDVAQARGAIILTAQKAGLDIAEYTPLQVKQSVVGYGKATKNQICLMLKAHLKGQCVPIQDDTADAVAIGLTHISRIGNSQIITKQSRIDTNPINTEKSQKNKLNDKIIFADLSYNINGILYKVFNELGGGYQEKYYYKAIEQELNQQKISFRKQVVVDLNYKNTNIGRYILDYLIDNKIVLELKVTPHFTQRDVKQVLAYLDKSNIELGILASFRKDRVYIKRILRGYNT